jgi:hypothetical protein
MQCRAPVLCNDFIGMSPNPSQTDVDTACGCPILAFEKKPKMEALCDPKKIESSVSIPM